MAFDRNAGGTTVTGAVLCPETEKRMIVSLDTSKAHTPATVQTTDPSQMNRILWVDKDNMLARLEAGIVGTALERKVACHRSVVQLIVAAGGVWRVHRARAGLAGVLHGRRLGRHAVRTWHRSMGITHRSASGMKKNIYGNIEDLVE